ncbi:hypothetical protein, partial [Bathymodiolus thermophilus thioautotrophic gill symbiont]
MSTLNRFIATLLTVFISQSFAANTAVITKFERIDVKTLQITLDQAVQGWGETSNSTNSRITYRLHQGETYYLEGPDWIKPHSYMRSFITPINPINRFSTQWTWQSEAVLKKLDSLNIDDSISIYAFFQGENSNGRVLEINSTIDLTDYPFTITTDNLTVNEETQTIATLTTNKDGTTFSLDGNTDNNNLFKIENNVLQFKNANGIDYETASSKIYTIHIKASKTGVIDITKTLTITLTDVNDNAPTEISLTGDIYQYTGIIEDNKRKIYDRAFSDTVATLTTADVDTNNTFTYTLIDNEKNTFKISEDGTKLELNGVDVDYETNVDKSFSFSIKVNDGNHEFIQNFKLEIKDVDDNPPSNILINTTDIANNIPAGMQVAYFSAVDADTVSTHIFTLYDLNGNDGTNADNNKFTLSTDGKLSIKETVNFATQA